MTDLLTDEQIRVSLDALPEWTQEGTSIVRTVSAPDFLTGIGWVDRVADAAEQAGHHPDIDVRYTEITFRLSTHSEGGLTAKDFDLAARIDELAA